MPVYDELYHHGIPDQKWGVRHGPPYPIARNSDGRARAVVSTDKRKMTKGTRKAYSAVRKSAADSRVAVKNAKRASKMHGYVKVSSLTNEQLEARIKRLEMEKKYKDLIQGSSGKSKNDQKKISKGSSEAGKALAKIAENSATVVVKAIVDATLGRLAPAPKSSRRTAYEEHLNAVRDRRQDKLADRKHERELAILREKNAQELRRLGINPDAIARAAVARSAFEENEDTSTWD